MREKIRIFMCYARKDEVQLQALKIQLAPLQRQGLIEEIWHDRYIKAGEDWKHEIDVHLDAAHIILLLISPDFLASDYCYEVEMKQALERQERGEARVIPIILASVMWQIPPLETLQALPKDAKPIATWQDKDEAFMNVAEGVDRVVREMIRRDSEQNLDQAGPHGKLNLPDLTSLFIRPSFPRLRPKALFVLLTLLLVVPSSVLFYVHTTVPATTHLATPIVKAQVTSTPQATATADATPTTGSGNSTPTPTATVGQTPVAVTGGSNGNCGSNSDPYANGVTCNLLLLDPLTSARYWSPSYDGICQCMTFDPYDPSCFPKS